MYLILPGCFIDPVDPEGCFSLHRAGKSNSQKCIDQHIIGAKIRRNLAVNFSAELFEDGKLCLHLFRAVFFIACKKDFCMNTFHQQKSCGGGAVAAIISRPAYSQNTAVGQFVRRSALLQKMKN